MSYYVNVDTEKKVLTIDDSVKPTSRDNLLIENYMKVGYVLRFKSKARAKKAKERQEKNLSISDIEELIKGNKKLEKLFKDIKGGKGEGHGVFAAKSWFKNEVVGKIEPFKDTTVEILKEEIEAKKAEAEEK